MPPVWKVMMGVWFAAGAVSVLAGWLGLVPDIVAVLALLAACSAELFTWAIGGR